MCDRYRSKSLGSAKKRINEWSEGHSARSTYLSLLDQGVQSADTTSVTRGHSIHFVHNQAGSRVNLQPRGIYLL